MRIKQIVIWLLLTSYLFALDATMEIIKNKSTLPTISYAISTDTQIEDNLDSKVLALVKKDLLVSGHFNNNDINVDNNYENIADYKTLKTNGIDLYLVLQLKKNPQDNSVVVNTKLYDVNANSLVLSKSYITSSIVRYPFLSHKIAIDINKYLKAPSIEWMDKFIIFSRYLD